MSVAFTYSAALMNPLRRGPVAVLGALAGVGLLAGCTSTADPGPTTVTSTVVTTSTAPPATETPKSEAPVPPKAAVSEAPAPNDTCPYISNQAAGDAEGDRVGRATVLTTDPVGCNFYFYFDPSVLVAQLTVTNYPSQTGAYNAMIRDTVASAERIGVQGLVERPGCSADTAQADRPEKCVDAVLFRTAFFPGDGNTDWAASFAVDGKVVTVKTRQDDVSFNARSLAAQVAPKFVK